MCWVCVVWGVQDPGASAVLEFGREVCAEMGVIVCRGQVKTRVCRRSPGTGHSSGRAEGHGGESDRAGESRRRESVGEKPECDVLLAPGGTAFHKRRDGPTDPTAPRGSWRQGPPNVP